jgi:hypothetical protein
VRSGPKIGFGDEIMRAEMRRSGGKLDIPFGHRLEQVRGGGGGGGLSGRQRGSDRRGASAGSRPLQLQRLASTGKNFGAGNPLWLHRGRDGSRRRGGRRRRGRGGRRCCLDEVRTRPLPLVHAHGRHHLRDVGGGRKTPGGPGRNSERQTATSGLRGRIEVHAVGFGRGGAAKAVGARKSAVAVAAAGEREGRKELKLPARKMDRLVWAAFGSPPKPSFVQAGHGF